MSSSDGRVLAIGVDAAEPKLVRRLIDGGDMPALQKLLNEGKWLRVESPAYLGSGSVWPTFISGEEPKTHGIYGEWSWRPATMTVERNHANRSRPFWQDLAAKNLTVGVLDVPFAPLIGLKEGFEITEWGPHDVLKGELEFSPHVIGDLIRLTPPHPLALDRLDASGPNDTKRLQRLCLGGLSGVKLRGELARNLIRNTRPHLSLINFTEIHHSSHYLWHEVFADDEFYAAYGIVPHPEIATGLIDIYREVDQQVKELIAASAAETVFVFSLHGMRATHGIPSFLIDLLCERGLARRSSWSDQSWSSRMVSLLGGIKRRTPSFLKRLYYRVLSPNTTQRLAKPTMMPAYDWSNTRAFSLPTDQHGWIRVNLRGREVAGVVAPEDYEQTCEELEQMLRSLLSEDGRPLVKDVLRPARSVEKALELSLPDIVVHWENVAFDSPLRIRGSKFKSHPIGTKFTGQHSLEGFCIIRGGGILDDLDYVKGAELGRLISRAVRAE